jgi:hypothetical protein
MPPSAKLLALFMVMSLCSWGIIARVHLIPWLDRRSQRDALLVVIAPQMFRTIGAMALFPGIGNPPPEWSVPLAWGDGATSVLAMVAMIALHKSWTHATKLVWVASVFGLLDMLHNAYNSVRLVVAPHLGPIGYVVGFGVPLMLVFHVLAFRALLRPTSSVVTESHAAP